MKNVLNKVIVILWVGFSIIFLISLVTNLEIKSSSIRNISLLLTVSGFVIMIIRILRIKIPENFNRTRIFLLVIISGLLLTMFQVKGDWNTQTIIYKHGHLNFKSIELQMQNKGASGYNRRIVEVTKLIGFLRIIDTVDTNKIGAPWIKVNIDINELKLKE